VRKAFIEQLEEACGSNPDIFLITADLGFNVFENFKKKYSDRFFNVGIGEPNMIGIAAGLALSGKRVYCYSIIPFLTTRCFEHIRIDICYHNLDVKLVGVGCGLSYGAAGVTHFATEDIAIMRTLPNMSVVVPADPYETTASISASLDHNGPMFIRLGKTGEPSVHSALPEFKLGEGISVLETGDDLCILASGGVVYNAKIAAENLSKKNIGTTLISLHTIKPIDKILIEGCAKKFKIIVTIEEHSIIGGLGSAVADILLETGYKGKFKKIGLPDKFNEYVGGHKFLCSKYNLDPESIKNNILRLLDN
jgi:transketolase